MKLTRNATIFAVINSTTTVVFLLTLNSLVINGQYEAIAPWAIAYGLTWALTGALLGGTDKARNYRGNIEYLYAAIQYLIALVVLWGTKLLLPAIMPLSYPTLLLVSILLVTLWFLHHRFVSSSPKGISKKEAFK